MVGDGAASSSRDSSTELLQAAVSANVNGGDDLRDRKTPHVVREVRGNVGRRTGVEREAEVNGGHRNRRWKAAASARWRWRLRAAWWHDARVLVCGRKRRFRGL